MDAGSFRFLIYVLEVLCVRLRVYMQIWCQWIRNYGVVQSHPHKYFIRSLYQKRLARTVASRTSANNHGTYYYYFRNMGLGLGVLGGRATVPKHNTKAQDMSVCMIIPKKRKKN